MKLYKKLSSIALLVLCLIGTSCKVFAPIKNKYNAIQKDLVPVQTKSDKPIPTAYTEGVDTTNSANIRWNTFFEDKNLTSLIDVALNNNLEL